MTTILERTYLTTRTEVSKMLDIARQRNTLASLYWFVEVKLPGIRTRSGKPVLQAAGWPQAHIPVIPVGADPEVSRHYAEMLKAFFEDGNSGTGIEHALALTSAEKLVGMDWYEFGREWDCICAQCGAVFRSTVANDKWCGCWE